MAKSITHLGHRIDTEGLHPLEEKVSAIREDEAFQKSKVWDPNPHSEQVI